MNIDFKSKKTNIPTIIVIFGATGDLTAKKIVPALFNLFEKQKLPEMFQVVGFSRERLSDKAFQSHIEKIVATHHKDKANKKNLSLFIKLFSYQQGFFENEDNYQLLAKVLRNIDNRWKVCTNKLFYLAVPPQFYEALFKNLANSGLTKPCSPKEGWTRVIVEKPFGEDLQTAQRLDELLASLFREAQIYRIDHYLAKEMVQNILTFRFSNNIFEQSWNNQFIERIDIRLLETIGVEDRGSFYDSTGALRDVGQNHLLQMLALVTMDNPINFEASSIREKRSQALQSLRKLSAEEIKSFTFRAQHEGYKTIKGVDSASRTETYFKIQAFLAMPRWQGVPIILESGKRLAEQRKEIVVTFKHPVHCLCPFGVSEHYKNRIIFSLELKEGIAIQFRSRKSGLDFETKERTFDFLFHSEEEETGHIDEYEKLLMDCIVGVQTLFVSTDEVKAMWRFIDPIKEVWQKKVVPLKIYAPDTNQPLKESKYVEDTSVRLEGRMQREIGVVGLGKMGSNISRRLMRKGWRIIGTDKMPEAVKELKREGLDGAYSLEELISKLHHPRVIWIMVPAGRALDGILFGKEGLAGLLQEGDIVIDGGNSFYKDSAKREGRLAKQGIRFMDVGVSGGPSGALNGASLMIGGKKELFKSVELLFYDLAQENGYQFFEGAGAGHFVKMVHNGIEYGMMQSIAEGFAILKNASYKLDLSDVVDVYNHGSVIESRLVGWLKNAFELHGEELKDVSGSVAHTGEGDWTVDIAKEENIKAKIIEESLKFRIQSERHPSYIGKILSALREQFGGHEVRKKRGVS